MDYKPNSYKSKEESKKTSNGRKKVEKVITGSARTKKRSEIYKLKDIFIAEDVSNVKDYIFGDVLVPAIKKVISDTVRDGIDMILYGNTTSKNSRDRRYSNPPYVNYNSSSKDYRKQESKSSIYDLDEIILETRGEAEKVLSQMDDIIDSYGLVKVSDLYDMIDISCPWTLERYGWTNIRSAEVIRLRGGDGYRLKLPRPMVID